MGRKMEEGGGRGKREKARQLLKDKRLKGWVT